MTNRRLAIEIARRLRQHGHTAWLAGGCVRDRLLGRTPKDHDIATSAPPEAVTHLFPGARTVGAHFGVVLIKQDGEAVEVATFRSDGPYKDGRRPESIRFASAEEDARRRDFTINGLFEDPESGELIDHVGGRADLETKTIRAIGDPAQRFAEDHLRLLRAVRFATVLDGFEIEPATWSALCHAALDLRRIAPERIRQELQPIWTSPRRQRGFDLLVQSRLIDTFWPEVRALEGCEQPPEFHPEGDVLTHTRLMIGMLPDDAPESLVLATLLHDIGKPASFERDETGRIRFHGHDRVGAEMAADMLRRLRYPNRTIDDVAFMVSRHMRFMHVKEMRVAKLKRFMAAPTFPQEIELHRVDCASSNGFTDNLEFVLEKQHEFSNQPIIPPPLLDGRDLLARGIPPGPRIGQLLAEAQSLQLEGEFTSREQALHWLDTRLSS